MACREVGRRAPEEAAAQQPLLQQLSGSGGDSGQIAIEIDGDKHLDIVQFSAPICYVQRDEGVLSIDVIRIGCFEGACSVKFTTLDGTATDRDDYHAKSQTIDFADGEDVKTVEVEIIKKIGFETTEEFMVQVSDPQGCQLGKYLHTGRVKVLGRGHFPTSKYADLLQGGEISGIEQVGGWPLYFEYMKWVLGTPGLGWRTVVTILIDQLPNLYVFVCLWMQLYIVDFLFAEDAFLLITTGPQTGRLYTAYLIAATYLWPVVIMHFASTLRETLDTEGRINCILKVHMLRKYLNYSDESRKRVPAARLEGMIVHKAQDVAKCYTTSLKVVSLIGKLMVLSTFQYMKDWHAFLSSSAMPLLMILFAGMRAPVLRHAAGAAGKAELELTQELHHVSYNFNLFDVYQKRPQAEETVRARAERDRQAHNDLAVVHANNEFLGHVLGPLFICIHIMWHTEDVIHGSMNLGAFVTTIAVFNHLSGMYTEAYETTMQISQAHGAIKLFAETLNLPVDLEARKQVNRKRRSGLKSARSEMRKNSERLLEAQKDGSPRSSPKATPITDLVPIQFQDMIYKIPKRVLFQDVNLSVRPGCIVAICGEHACGKSTLMRILAQNLLPSGGSVFVPSHLRALYVEQNAAVMQVSAWNNLIFGDANASPQRVIDICSDLRMHYVKQVVQQDLAALGRLDELEGHKERQTSIVISSNWQTELSHAEAAKIHLARALIMSPEILVAQRPLGNFNFGERGQIMQLLKDFVANRGVRQPEEDLSNRRPRTLFFSPTWRQDLDEADVLWEIKDGNVIVRDMSDMKTEEIDHLFSGKPEEE